jgi:hypothetical protein
MFLRSTVMWGKYRNVGEESTVMWGKYQLTDIP